MEAFKQHWGAEMVPPDICHTVDTVEEDLNLCPTMWSDSLCHLDEEKDASTVDPVDDYQDQFNYGIIHNYENTDKECVIDQLYALGAKEQLIMFLTGSAGAGKTTAVKLAQQFCFEFC